jgi:8-oxo-dGTP pyrophosphatase MutT (NUDIX family)
VPEPRNPWRRRTRRTVYDNAWIRVHHDDVIRPDGTPGIYGVVEFRNIAVAVVALDAAGRVLLVGQFRYTLDAYSWELPEGGVPHDEQPLEGAKRELAEETGYRADTWRELVRLATSNSVTDETGVIYEARGLTPGTAHPDATEELATRWVGLDEAVGMVDRGEITDAMSQVGLLRVALERATAQRSPGEAGVRERSASGSSTKR